MADYEILKAEAAAGFRAVAKYCAATRAGENPAHPSCFNCPMGLLCKDAVGDKYLCNVFPAMAEAVEKDNPLA